MIILAGGGGGSLVLEDLVDLASDGGVGAMATSLVLLQVLHDNCFMAAAPPEKRMKKGG